MKRKWIFALLIMIALAVGLFIALKPPLEVLSDDSIFTQSPCQIPCWHNLTPGQNTMEEVRAAIPQIAFVRDAGALHEGQIEDKYYIGWQHKVDLQRSGGSFVFKDNMLHSIILHPNLRFSLQDILEYYGEPAGFDYSYHISIENMSAFLEISLYYPHSGLVIPFQIYAGPAPSYNYGSQPIVNYTILPGAQGFNFALFPAVDTLEELVIEKYEQDIESAQLYIQFLFHVGWPGLYSIIANPALNGVPATPYILTPDPTDLARIASVTASP